MSQITMDCYWPLVTPETEEHYRASEEYQNYLNANKIQMNVLQEFGPRGRNPLVQYSGERKSLEEFIDREFGLLKSMTEPYQKQYEFILSNIVD